MSEIENVRSASAAGPTRADLNSREQIRVLVLLGPVVVAITRSLLEIWRSRHGVDNAVALESGIVASPNSPS